jgi:hypothetical protein
MKTVDPYTTKARLAHHRALETLQPKKSGIQTWRALRRLEAKAHQIATDYCNGEITAEQVEAFRIKLHSELFKTLGAIPKGFFCNLDPRGYSLKIRAHHVPEGMHTDWGRDGILAAEIN